MIYPLVISKNLCVCNSVPHRIFVANYFLRTLYLALAMDLTDVFFRRSHNSAFSSFMTYHRACNKSNTMGSICGAGTDHTSGTPEFTPVSSSLVISRFRVSRSLVFCVISLFVSIGHCIICLHLTISDYPFGIFKLV